MHLIFMYNMFGHYTYFGQKMIAYLCVKYVWTFKILYVT